jgi:hypothetical protein
METIVQATLAVAWLAIAAVLAGLLVGILPGWRRLMGDGHRLPVWLFRRRTDVPLEARAVLLAEMRCELCGERDACLRRLKGWAAQPPEHCPNAALFEGGRLDQSFLTKASRSAGRMPAA